MNLTEGMDAFFTQTMWRLSAVAAMHDTERFEDLPQEYIGILLAAKAYFFTKENDASEFVCCEIPKPECTEDFVSTLREGGVQSVVLLGTPDYLQDTLQELAKLACSETEHVTAAWTEHDRNAVRQVGVRIYLDNH